MKDVVIKTFENEVTANMAQNKVEAYGIKSVAMRLSGNKGGSASNSTELRVLEKDVEKAKELLEIK